MLRTERGSLRRQFDDFLLDVFKSGVCSASLSIFLAAFSLHQVMLPILGGLVLTAGIAYGGCAFLQRPRPSGAPRIAYRLRASEKRLGILWSFTGLLLIVLGTLLQPPVLLTSIGGAIACLMLHRRGHALELRWSRMPERARRDAKQSRAVAALLTLPFLLTAYTGFAYAGLPVVEIHEQMLQRGSVNEGDPPSDGDSGLGETRRLSYAELCGKLPDPQQIGYGLGDLFEHDGAVAAGCGEPAIRVGETTWASPGFCDGELRSLGVVGEGREPVLLYGAPARLAWDEARSRDLRFAEAAELAGGEVVLIGTDEGTLAFARSSPALKPGRGDAVRCEEIDEIARPFTELQAPLARLWQELLVTENEWIWPAAAAGTGVVVFQGSDGLPVYGSCESGPVCRLDGPDLHRSAEGPATISIEQLEAYASVAAGE